MLEHDHERIQTTQSPETYFSCKGSKKRSGCEKDRKENADAETPESSCTYLTGKRSQIHAGYEKIRQQPKITDTFFSFLS